METHARNRAIDDSKRLELIFDSIYTVNSLEGLRQIWTA